MSTFVSCHYFSIHDTYFYVTYLLISTFYCCKKNETHKISKTKFDIIRSKNLDHKTRATINKSGKNMSDHHKGGIEMDPKYHNELNQMQNDQHYYLKEKLNPSI